MKRKMKKLYTTRSIKKDKNGKEKTQKKYENALKQTSKSKSKM